MRPLIAGTNLRCLVGCALCFCAVIGDPHRGSAWTRAVLGVLAPEIHLCGDPATEDALRAICAITGDEIEVRANSARFIVGLF
jgi:hypothetical protein